MMRLVVVGALLVACTATQSARTVTPGVTELSVGLGRISQFEQDVGEGAWTGHVALRRGIADGFDLGLRVEHTPGAGGNGALGLDPRIRVASRGLATLGLGAPVGVLWVEGEELKLDGVVAAPAVYLSLDMSPTTELVVNVRYGIGYVRRDDITETYVTRTGSGGSLGVRVVAPDRSWTVLPELGLLRTNDSATFLTLGVTLAVGR